MITVKVTDHALVRWLQRAHDIDMEDMRAKLAAIAQPYVDAAVKHAEIGGLWFIFEDDRLITITPSKPDLHALKKNDRKFTNGTDVRHGPMHWKGRQRKRNHK